MDISKLKKLDDYRWTLQDEHKPVVLFADQALLKSMDEMVIEQISNVSQLPGLVGHAMTMPDAHWGYGFPIGGVAAFDAEAGGVVSAGGVGFDISCGIRCLRTNLVLEDMLPHIEKLADKLYHGIPAGVGYGGKLKVSIKEIDTILGEGAKWAIKNGYGRKEDLLYIEERGTMAGAEPSDVSLHAKERQLTEMGTLGSGNHYLEVQIVKDIFDVPAARAFGLSENQIIISIHCGSRGLGHQVASDYLVKLAKAAQDKGIIIPHRDLACAPILSKYGQAYLGAMNAGINCALANRQILSELTRRIFNDVFPKANIETLYDVSHNTCKQETHIVKSKEKTLYVHRKGATRAFGPNHPSLPEQYKSVGQPVCIGGSMGTSSYILAGNAEEENLAFASACHGAGRQMSRNQALKNWTGKDLIQSLLNQGIYIKSSTMRGVAEEAPGAYRDVDQVVTVTENARLARRVVKLKPIISVKG